MIAGASNCSSSHQGIINLDLDQCIKLLMTLFYNLSLLNQLSIDKVINELIFFFFFIYQDSLISISIHDIVFLKLAL